MTMTSDHDAVTVAAIRLMATTVLSQDGQTLHDVLTKLATLIGHVVAGLTNSPPSVLLMTVFDVDHASRTAISLPDSDSPTMCRRLKLAAGETAALLQTLVAARVERETMDRILNREDESNGTKEATQTATQGS